MARKLLDVKAIEEFKLKLIYDNSEIRIIDMKLYLNIGNFKKLNDINFFKTVRVSFDTIQWGKNIDFDPEVLYDISVKV